MYFSIFIIPNFQFLLDFHNHFSLYSKVFEHYRLITYFRKFGVDNLECFTYSTILHSLLDFYKHKLLVADASCCYILYLPKMKFYFYNKLEAEKLAEVSAIEWRAKLVAQEHERKISEVADATQLARSKALTDAEYYRAMKEAEASHLKLTPAYLELAKYQALAQNSKVYFTGDQGNLIMDLLNQMSSSLSKSNVSTKDQVTSSFV
ncbi:unnamed protein product [Schistosoma mattheei]|uniref:Uncharacterized protein n=1 Tax=Schistosoma mattheei TaxID=31246 RepID=A0A3P8HFY6_9TREM|nr:unnamed protein product [Schistosoma mattheei]